MFLYSPVIARYSLSERHAIMNEKKKKKRREKNDFHGDNRVIEMSQVAEQCIVKSRPVTRTKRAPLFFRGFNGDSAAGARTIGVMTTTSEN